MRACRRKPSGDPAGGRAAGGRQEPALHQALVGLDDAHRPLPPALHRRQVRLGHAARAQAGPEHVRRHGRVLEGHA